MGIIIVIAKSRTHGINFLFGKQTKGLKFTKACEINPTQNQYFHIFYKFEWVNLYCLYCVSGKI